MIAHIFIGTNISTKYIGEFVVGVDVACYHMLKAGYKDFVAIGDFDSCTIDEFVYIEKKLDKVKRFESEKDDTDLALAIDYVLNETTYDTIVIHNAFKGNRVDHLLGNILSLQKGLNEDVSIHLMDEYNHMYLLGPGEYEIKTDHQYVSFFPISEVSSLTLNGFKYELSDVTLKPLSPLCISNELKKVNNSVKFERGLVLVVEASDV